MKSQHDVLYGERVGDLMPGLMRFRRSMHKNPDGSYSASTTLTEAEATPLRRALLRVEAELMEEDADRLGTPDWHDRTYEQRAADALVHLVRAISQRHSPNAA